MEAGGTDDVVNSAEFEGIVQMATDLFEGDQSAAMNWLTTSKAVLQSRTPVESVRTESGAEEVKDLIGRLEHGSFS
jgi:putative toxin-antitoxin system antitoxin component (TIGR02293 family)